MDIILPKGCSFVPVERHEDTRGELAVLTDNIPGNFRTERAYYVKGLKTGSKRGAHAHRVQSQIIFVLEGELVVTLNDGDLTVSLEMKEGSDGLLMGPVTWCTIEAKFGNSLYLILADGPYDKSEYITDFEEYGRLRQWRA